MNEFWGIILGAILAVGGGAANDEISSWRERRRERKAISVSISDELTEIQQVLTKIKNVWEGTHTLIPSYIRDLKSCTSAYDNLRPRLFLIKEDGLRRKITTFYRDLKCSADKDSRKAGSLSKNEDAQNEQQEIADRLIKLLSDAADLQSKLQ